MGGGKRGTELWAPPQKKNVKLYGAKDIIS